MNTFPQKEAHFLLPGNAGNLEVVTTYPTGNAQNKVILICHPHPLQGGTMDNKVVTTLVRTFNELGFKTVRFNFRGVGQSEGMHDHGEGEADDAVTILNWISEVLPNDELWIAGFSFGSYVAYKVATSSVYQDRIKQLICIAPPVQYPQFSELPVPTMPWVIAQGEQDEIVNAQAVYDWAQQFMSPPKLIKMAKTGHFFHGKLVELKNFLKEELG